MIGETLGHYRIEAKLGEGGMGVVYRARDAHLDRPVAIKVLAAEALSDAARKKRFVQEARTASALNHPNILHIYDIDQAECSLGRVDFIAMEYVPGRTLEQVLGPGPRAHGLELAQALRYAVQITDALARAHAAGIVHRDIKPANIMVTAEGQIKLLDFGLAKLTERIEENDVTETIRWLDSPRTEQGVILGTLAYMSPEQAQGGKVDERADIFSFGAVLYEMLTGQRAFQGDSKIATLSAILSKEPKPLVEVLPVAPAELGAIVAGCLRKVPEQRFGSMSEVKAALEDLVQETSAARRTSSIRRMASARPRRLQSRRVRLAAAAVVVLALAFALTPVLRRRLAARLGIVGFPAGTLIAILPPQTAGGDAAAQEFDDGLSEVLIRRLCAVEQFQPSVRLVAPGELRGNARRSPEDARKTLGVPLALAGTATRQPDKLRWSAALIDTRTLQPLRRTAVDLPLRDVSRLEDALVGAAARLAGMDLPPAATLVLHTGMTAVPEAYEAYLRAHAHLRHSDRAEELDAAIGLFQKALDRDASFGLAHAGLGEACWAKSSLRSGPEWAEKGRQSCLRALANKAELAQVHVVLGRIYAGTGRFQEAVAEFQRSLELDPLVSEGHAGLGAAYAALGRLSDAEATYRKLIELRPGYYYPYSHLAVFYTRQGRYRDAEAAFRKVIELAPENSLVYRNIGGVYHLMGRFEDAAAALKRSLALGPTAAAYSNLGTLYFFQGQYSDSVSFMEKAAELETENYLYWGNLADAYRWSPEHKKNAPQAYRRAIQLAGRAVAMNPHDADLRASLAVYYTKLPDAGKALAEIGQARRQAPTQPRVLFKAGLVYEILGRREAALGALKLAVQAGYSIEEIRREPELAALRADPRYKELDLPSARDRANP